MTPTKKRTISNGIQLVLFAAWSIAGLMLCAKIWPALGGVGAPPIAAISSIRLWLIVTALLLIFILFFARTYRPASAESDPEDPGTVSGEARRDRFAIRLGLAAAFACALPGLVLGVVGLLVALPDYMSFNLQPDEVRLQIPAVDGNGKPGIDYVLAVDISSSFLSSTQLQAQEVQNNLKGLQTFLCFLLESVPNGHFQRAILGPDDRLYLTFFAFGESRLEEIDLNHVGNAGKARVAALIDRIKSRLQLPSDPSVDRSKTNLVEAVEFLVSQSSSERFEKSRHVTLIVASDFYHDLDTVQEAEARGRLQRAMEKMSSTRKAHLVGLVGQKLPEHGGSDGGLVSESFNVLPIFSGASASGDWRSLNLNLLAKDGGDGNLDRSIAIGAVLLPLDARKETLKAKYDIHGGGGRSDTSQSMVFLPDTNVYGKTAIVVGSLSTPQDYSQLPRLLLGSPGGSVADDPSVTSASAIFPRAWAVSRDMPHQKSVTVSVVEAGKNGSRQAVPLFVACPASGWVHQIDLILVPVHTKSVAEVLRTAVMFLALVIVLIGLSGATAFPEMWPLHRIAGRVRSR